ncbi:MAG: CHRD domain-containing protein [Gemmatimonadaceae bacterium]|nr:CHRD domain-containing protein [Gemmatimonadaceae bacterium]
MTGSTLITVPTPVATYRAALSGANENPPSGSPASGTATFVLTGTTANYSITSTAFGTTLSGGHIHIGTSTVNGPVIVPVALLAQSGTLAAGSINFSQATFTNGSASVSGDSLKKLFDTGAAYVNFHTAAFGGGEVRGQIIKQ